MFSDNIFRIALLVSIIAHGAILLQNPDFSILPKPKKGQEVKISYVKTKPSSERQLRNNLPAARRDEPFLNLAAKITLDKTDISAAKERAGIFEANPQRILPAPLFKRPALVKPDVIAIKKKIQLSIPNPNPEKLNSLSYISHSQMVREKIRRALYQNYSGTNTGIVNLSFLVTNYGRAGDIRIVDEGSSASATLREIAVKSIKDAAPFHEFPKDLDYPQLSFSVTISFEIE